MFAFNRYLNFPKAPIWMLDSVLNTSVEVSIFIIHWNCYSNKHFNVAVRLIWRRDVGQHQTNVETTLYVNVEIYNVEQRRINVVYFNNDINNVKQDRNNVVIFNVEFHKADQSRNNVVNMIISKKLIKAKKYFWVFLKN